MELVSDLQTYQALLAQPSSWGDILPDAPAFAEFFDELVRFSSLRFAGFLPSKICALKRLYRRTVALMGRPAIKVKFHLIRAGHTYMLDSGEVHFCKQFLFSTPFEKNVAMALHELAHVYLSGLEGYAQLLALDSEFVDYLKSPSQTVIAPVEFYANILANRWLAAVVERLPNRQRALALEAEIALVQEKLAKAIEQL